MKHGEKNRHYSFAVEEKRSKDSDMANGSFLRNLNGQQQREAQPNPVCVATHKPQASPSDSTGGSVVPRHKMVCATLFVLKLQIFLMPYLNEV